MGAAPFSKAASFAVFAKSERVIIVPWKVSNRCKEPHKLSKTVRLTFEVIILLTCITSFTVIIPF
jgi:hypothetical protein